MKTLCFCILFLSSKLFSISGCLHNSNIFMLTLYPRDKFTKGKQEYNDNDDSLKCDGQQSMKCDCLMLDDEESGSESNFSEKLSGQISTKDYNKEPVNENIQGNDERKFCVKYYC